MRPDEAHDLCDLIDSLWPDPMPEGLRDQLAGDVRSLDIAYPQAAAAVKELRRDPQHGRYRSLAYPALYARLRECAGRRQAGRADLDTDAKIRERLAEIHDSDPALYGRLMLCACGAAEGCADRERIVELVLGSVPHRAPCNPEAPAYRVRQAMAQALRELDPDRTHPLELAAERMGLELSAERVEGVRWRERQEATQ